MGLMIVQWLEAEFRRIQCFLEDADTKQEGDRRVKNWVRDVRDVAYNAEDVIDTFLFKVAPPLRRRGFVNRIRRYAFTPNELIARHEVGLEIKRIKNKIRTISDSRSTYGIENIGQQAGTSSAGRSPQEWRLTSPLSQEPDFVGFEKDMEILVAQLMEGESPRCVVSVVGMGGLGKTTLIRKVYNNTRVKTHFHFCEWISISQEYSVKDLLQNFIYCHMVLSKEDLKKVPKMNVFELSYKISLYLQEKRYLMVLDDIWTMEAWNSLKDAFPDVNNGSRIVLTTRNRGVALYADPRSQPHELRFLTNEESWDLFCKKTLILIRDGGFPQDLEKLGREIVEKCHGLPLAIAVIGGLLSVKEPREWENVRKSISWQFVKGEVKISHILSLSYEDLPNYLKPCFLYLGNFPEDREFRAKELIQMWAAEGFLQQRGEETLEEVGEDCLKELIQRSMVQVARRSSSGNIKSCRIHDLLRDLSISEAKEGMFLQVHSGINANAPPASRARRVAIHHNNLSEYISLSCSTPHLRSVLIYTQGSTWLQREEEKFLFTGFKLLRVLYIHGAGIKELPREIGELIHLRYLGCTHTSLERLPSSIGNLPNLQTLFVESSCITVPSTIGKMKQLRHFQVNGRTKGSEGYGKIQGRPMLDRINSLQTLSFVISGKWMEDGCLGKLTNLRKLGIFVNTETHAGVLYESIVNLDCLHSLNLQGILSKLPDSSFFPTNLTNLTLKFSRLEEDPMATLEKLKNLRILKLLGDSYDGHGVEMACSAQGFPRLESLHLERLYLLEEWRVEEGSMPRLLYLRINRCVNLNKLPEGLQHVRTLSKLELSIMPHDFIARLEEDGGEDWYKIRRISSIDISGTISRL